MDSECLRLLGLDKPCSEMVEDVNSVFHQTPPYMLMNQMDITY